jgi:hypothetical protein
MVKPDPTIAADGFFYGLALGTGMQPGTLFCSFSVLFDYLLLGTASATF